MNDFEKGRAAALQNFPRFVCPYPNGTQAQRDWLRGYEYAYRCLHG